MRISDWSSDVCSSDLNPHCLARAIGATPETATCGQLVCVLNTAGVCMKLILQTNTPLENPGHGMSGAWVSLPALKATGEEIADTRSTANVAGDGIQHEATVKLTVFILKSSTGRDKP